MFDALRESKKTISKTKKQIFIYGFFYYMLNFITIITTFIVGTIAIIFLAGASKYYGDSINPYKSWLNLDSNYVLTTTIINAILSLFSGIISFFLVNTKFIEKKSLLNKLNMEMMIYEEKKFYYGNKKRADRDYILYKRVFYLANKEKFDREEMIEWEKQN
ncbi:DUF4231 domain-containing protein [Mycoplasma anatis]|uniref:DUF4231 domain-containing protein n=1 Tax=Mycoplasmopsis anatis TaxID=171279 RepID=UPI001C4E15B5|nr:DUF4231 domain-containing protein [Mycoplasmopsis anatis]MBW0596002.1 DUF4231 domain-containing protein [Mycoplasmopsis anatis]MBW0596579.1 DUF4231 domain-containing protein [Mycoplasmopsis anatis]MBW0597481.1 DUF4231 domain-containing protein [Mycoplasmopsis anatis]MBW0599726.1 DUF4231 domain-containing protein [Mycoplasmopsis anatis]MBW0600360.1 DUF4231 domain-containing protein [Mycoplasmopsis anatis]